MFKTQFIKRIPVADNTYAFLFNKPEGYSFLPGQHCTLFLDDIVEPTRNTKHTFSFTSDPLDDTVRFATRIRGSIYKQKLMELKRGDEVFLGIPGGFSIGDKADQKQIFIVAGIGITPVLSYLASLSETHPVIQILCSNKNNSTTPFIEDFLTGEFAQVPKLTVTYITTKSDEGDHKGERIGQSILEEFLKDRVSSQIYLFGSENFVDDISSYLAQLGIPWDNIKSESFAGY